MVMKVDSVRSYYYNTNFKQANEQKLVKNELEIKNLSNVTPDFAINKPISYSNLGIETLNNGLKVHSYKLANGHRVTIIPMEGSPAVVKNYVNVGSMNETQNIKGISHFLEHMAFNGTNGQNGHIKLEVGDSFKKIDELGGWTNASTNYAITDYVNSTPQLKSGDLEKQIKVIAAMTEDLKLSDEMIEKEKKPVCSEINMILDNPQTIALDQTVRALFKIKNPADELVGGSVAHIQNLTRKDVLDYYNKYYTPDNMNLVITGDVNPDEVIKLVAKNFNSKKISQGKKFEEKLTPINNTIRKDFTSDKATSTEIILGFSGPKNNDVKENIAFDIARAYLGSSFSNLGKNLKQYNSYPYIASEKISTNPNNPQMIYLATSCTEKNSEKALKSIFNSISSQKPISQRELDSIKQNLLKSHNDYLEYSSNVNDSVGRAILDGNIEYFTKYDDIVKNMTVDDVNNTFNKYFDLNKTAVILVHPKNNNVSFKGTNKRLPINNENISEYKLNNNFDVGLYKTKNSNIDYNIMLKADTPYNKKAGVVELLNEIYSMGTKSYDEDAWNKYMEENNFNISIGCSKYGISVNCDSIFDKRNNVYKYAKDLLYSPNITQENLEIAKSRLKDYLSRQQDSANRLYNNFEASNNPYEFTEGEILNSIDNITLEDLKECHNYLVNNSRGIVTANLPYGKENIVKDEILKNVSVLNIVKPNSVNYSKIYTENKKAKVLQKVNNNSQADIMQVYKFQTGNTIKENILAELTNSILTNSSIGLFNNLREKEHLAYSVYSNISRTSDRGELSCHILTTTDNKEIGEYSYDNVQKSIDGFNRQINELINGNFTELDFENAKLALKADLLDSEGTPAKLGLLSTGLNSKYGINYLNQLYEQIDGITKDDIISFADKIFSNKPIYSITASKDTLDYNKEYLKNLEN